MKNKKICFFIILIGCMVTNYVSYSDDSKEKDLRRLLAEAYVEKKDYNNAILECEKILEKSSNDTKTRELLADILSWNKKYNESILEYKKILELEPENLSVMKKLADVLTWENKYPEAIETYRVILGISPEVETRIKLAEVLSWDKRYEDAISEYEKIIKEDPQNMEAKQKLSEVLGYNKNLLESIKVLKEILSKNPLDTLSRAELAEKLSWVGNYAESIKEYEEVLKVKPEDLNITYKFANVLKWNGDYARSEGIYRVLLKENAQKYNEKTVFTKEMLNEEFAEILSWQGKYKESFEIYKKILLENPGNIKSKIKLARILIWMKNYKEGLNIYDELIADNPDPDFFREKARAYSWMWEYEKAIKEYEKSIKNGGDEKVILEMKAKKAYFKRHMFSAIKFYTKLINEDSKNLDSMFDLAQIYSRQSMWDKSREAYKKLLTISPVFSPAKKGLDKVERESKKVFFSTGYEYYEADSQARDSDIKRHLSINTMSVPVNDNLKINSTSVFGERFFSDFNDTFENKETVGISYLNNPMFYMNAFYGIYSYNHGMRSSNTFGTNIGSDFFESGKINFSYLHDRLENTSRMIREGRYNDSFAPLVNIDISERIKFSSEYKYARYSDSNYKNDVFFDVTYIILFDPTRFEVKYKYAYEEFYKKVSEYFSPKGFTTNTVSLYFRHFLFSGATFCYGNDDLFYELGYDITIDSLNVVGHKFTGGLSLPLNKKLFIDVKGSINNSSYKVYKDKYFSISLKAYF